MKIYKYPLEYINQWFELSRQQDAEFLCVQMQPHIGHGYLQNTGTICAWFKVDETKPLVAREYILVGTGIDFSEVGMAGGEKYLGTVQSNGFVWHLFERFL